MADHKSETEKNKKKLGIALVGLGKYATGQLLPALEQTNLMELKGIVTGSPEKADKYSKKYHLPEKNIYNYENFDTIKDNPEIDVVYIVLPNFLHAEYTIRAAKAGKHVICEKPMAVSVEECESMIAACQKAQKLLFIGYRLHYEPYNLEAMRLGQQAALGPVKEMEANFGYEVGKPDQWRLNKQMAGGGSLMDVGIYCIQAARYVTGKEPCAISSATITSSTDLKFREVESDIKWKMEFQDGITAYCYASYTKDLDHLFVETSKGWFELEPAFEYSGQTGRTFTGEMDLPQINQQQAQLDGMAETVLFGKENKATGEEGLQDVSIIKAIYESAEKGERVELPEPYVHFH